MNAEMNATLHKYNLKRWDASEYGTISMCPKVTSQASVIGAFVCPIKCIPPGKCDWCLLFRGSTVVS